MSVLQLDRNIEIVEFLRELNEFLKERFDYKRNPACIAGLGNCIDSQLVKCKLYLRYKSRINGFAPDTLIISRIGFRSQRVGHATAFLKFVLSVSEKYGIKHIGSENANPAVMEKISMKFGFEEFSPTMWSVPVNRVKLENPVKQTRWLDDVVNALNNLGGIGHLSEIYKEVKKIRGNVPKSYEAIIRRRIEDNSSDTSTKTKSDIFYSVDGIGSGRWGLRSVNAIEHTNEVEYQSHYPPTIKPTSKTPGRRRKGNNRASVVESKIPDRSANEGETALELADYKCELNNTHATFSRDDGKQFMEKHHLIPMKEYNNFELDIDHHSNIVSLCPTCHQHIHLGRQEDVKPLLMKLYAKRSSQLENYGVDFNDLVKMYFST